MAGADTTVPIGVYRGSTPDLGRITAYEAFLGMPEGTTVDYVLAFMADHPTWAQFERGILQSTTNGSAGTASAFDWAPLLGSRKLMLGVPACVQATTWAQEAAGGNDAHWAALARNLMAAGLGGCALRIGREFNTGYSWKATPGNAASYTAGYARVVNVMRDAGFAGTFVWNPMIGQGNFGPSAGVETVYPGDDVIDVIGLDLYDTWGYPAWEQIRTAAQQQDQWAHYRDQWDGLTGWRSLAANHGKPLCYPEWGLGGWNTGSGYTGGGDNPLFITEMAAWLKDTGAWMHALWEDAGMGVCDPDDLPARRIAMPQARAAYLAAFGYQN